MKRLQFVVRDDVHKALESLKEKTGANSLAEVFRDALRTYAWVVSELEQGRQVVSRSVDPQTATKIYSHLETALAAQLGREDDVDQDRQDRPVEESAGQTGKESDFFLKGRDYFEEQARRLTSAFEAGRSAMKEEIRQSAADRATEGKEGGRAG